MRLLGAPAIPAPGLHPFWGSAPSAFGGRSQSLQQNAEQAAPFGHDPKADAGFRKDRAPAKPYCALPTSSHMEAGAALRQIGKPAPLCGPWRSPRAGGLMCDVKE